jgi:hypothetical protein
MTFEDFCYSFVGWPWFAEEERPKTFAAMQTFWKKTPARDLDRIPPTIVFAPTPYVRGHVQWLFYPAAAPVDSHRAFIYLAPSLERQQQSRVNSTVAHEFAHAILGHGTWDSTQTEAAQAALMKIRRQADLPDEVQADALIAKWGFRKAYDRRRKHGYKTGRR